MKILSSFFHPHVIHNLYDPIWKEINEGQNIFFCVSQKKVIQVWRDMSVTACALNAFFLGVKALKRCLRKQHSNWAWRHQGTSESNVCFTSCLMRYLHLVDFWEQLRCTLQCRTMLCVCVPEEGDWSSSIELEKIIWRPSSRLEQSFVNLNGFFTFNNFACISSKKFEMRSLFKM